MRTQKLSSVSPVGLDICIEATRKGAAKIKTCSHATVSRESLRTILCINAILETAFGTPDLGNKVDPLDELLYLLIAQRTRIDLARRIFDELHKEFSPWNTMFDQTKQAKVMHILSQGGRGNLRYQAIMKAISRINETFGTLSLETLREYSRAEAENFLLSLPGVGMKTAYCVLMYSLGYDVFPVDSNILRILTRTNAPEPFGLQIRNMDHRTAQEKIPQFIPKDVAYSLHVNMVVHGRTICTPRKPKCSICPIRLFCDSYRQTKYGEGRKFRLTMVDLFCGAGGISYGFSRAGIRPVLAADNYDYACATYALNIPWIDKERVVNKDITEIPEDKVKSLVGPMDVDILVAGVPCKGFSRVGLKSKPLLKRKKSPEKERVNELFLQVVKWTRAIRPLVVLIENVPDMENSRIFYEHSKTTVKDILEKSFADIGYSTTVVHLNSAKFGIPESRKRLFFIAARGCVRLDAFEKRMSKFWQKLDRSKNSENAILRSALKGVPNVLPGEGKSILVPRDYPERSELETSYERFTYDSPLVIFNHVARKHNEDDMMIISSLLQGESYKQLLFRKPLVIKDRKRKVYSIKSFHDKFYRLEMGKPSRTIVSHLAKDGNSFIHPIENRSLTVREAARIQSFPDSFIFIGPRTGQFVQAGNAVPPLLAYIIGLFLSKLIKEGMKHG